MQDNIYDDTFWDNGINFCNDDYTYDRDRHDESCFDSRYGRPVFQVDYAELLRRTDRLERMLYALYKKDTGHKGKEKKCCKAKAKKYWKRIRKLEKQNADISRCLAVMIQQSQVPDRYGWITRSIENSAPRIVDLMSNIVTSSRQPLPTAPSRPLQLPDKDSIK